jgi:hypothetical protein
MTTTSKADGGPNTFTYVAITIILVLAAMIVYRDHPLVVFTSDKPNQALFATSDLEPGTSTSNDVTLGNAGLIPFDYSLAVEDAAGRALSTNFGLRIVRELDGRVLYDGPLAGDTGRLDSMMPGDSVKLALRLSLAPSAAKQSLNVYLKWHAHATVLVGWWRPIVLAVAGLAVLAMSVLLGYFWRRRRRALVSAPGLVG